jgi:hypothetical protein
VSGDPVKERRGTKEQSVMFIGPHDDALDEYELHHETRYPPLPQQGLANGLSAKTQ